MSNIVAGTHRFRTDFTPTAAVLAPRTALRTPSQSGHRRGTGRITAAPHAHAAAGTIVFRSVHPRTPLERTHQLRTTRNGSTASGVTTARHRRARHRLRYRAANPATRFDTPASLACRTGRPTRATPRKRGRLVGPSGCRLAIPRHTPPRGRLEPRHDDRFRGDSGAKQPLPVAPASGWSPDGHCNGDTVGRAPSTPHRHLAHYQCLTRAGHHTVVVAPAADNTVVTCGVARHSSRSRLHRPCETGGSGTPSCGLLHGCRPRVLPGTPTATFPSDDGSLFEDLAAPDAPGLFPFPCARQAGFPDGTIHAQLLGPFQFRR